jgi:hypothetical protein
MKSRRPALLYLEQLEDRLVPSLTMQFCSGTLYVSGLPTGNVLLTETSANTFQVLDGTTTLGSHSRVSNIDLDLTNHQGKSVNVNLNGHTLSGNLCINEGEGDTSGDIGFLTGVSGGRIGGSLLVWGGGGEEVFSPGLLASGVSGVNPTPGSLSVGGDIIFNAGTNNAPTEFNVLDTGVLYGASSPSVRVTGNIFTTAVAYLGIGSNTTVAKSVSLTDPGEQAQPGVMIAGTIGHNLTVSSGDGGTAVNLIGATIGGNVRFDLGDGDNTFDLDSATTVGGYARITGGAGADDISIEGTVKGNLTVDLGDGTNTFSFTGTTLGNLKVLAGDGDNTITTADPVLGAGTVGGNLTILVGDGNNFVTLGNAPGKTLFWTSGDGSNNVTLGALASVGGQFWHVHMTFGTGSDTVTLSADAGSAANPAQLSGFIDMDGPVAGNSFDPTAQLTAGTWVTVKPFTLHQG